MFLIFITVKTIPSGAGAGGGGSLTSVNLTFHPIKRSRERVCAAPRGVSRSSDDSDDLSIVYCL